MLGPHSRQHTVRGRSRIGDVPHREGVAWTGDSGIFRQLKLQPVTARHGQNSVKELVYFSAQRGRFVKRLGLMVTVVFLLCGTTTASASDWRWAPLPKHKITYHCTSKHCRYKAKKRRHHQVMLYNRHRRAEWNHWTSLYIPDCIWYGESGYGPKYSRVRYTMPNSNGSGAFGKFQFMSGTYHNNAKYHDWSPLDQEIAARREYWRHGTAPWTNC